MRMMVRQSLNDFDAFQTANAMTFVGAEVVSIACDTKGIWHVFARVRDEEHIQAVDAMIDEHLYGKKPEGA